MTQEHAARHDRREDESSFPAEKNVVYMRASEASALERKVPGNLFGIPLPVGFALLVYDLLALILAVGLSTFLVHYTEILFNLRETNITTLPDDKIFIVLCVMELCAYAFKGHYSRRIPWWSQVRYISNVSALIFLTHGFLSFALKMNEPFLWVATGWLLNFLFILLFRSLVYRKASRTAWWEIPTVVISDNATAMEIVYAFDADKVTGHDIRKIFLRGSDSKDFDITELPAHCRHIEIDISQSDYQAYILKNPELFYVISLDSLRGSSREALVSTLNDRKISYAIVSASVRTSLYQTDPQYFFGHDVIMLQPRLTNEKSAGFQTRRLVKRVLDIAVSACALLALLPVFIAVGAMLKIEGQGGSLFYGGKRVGCGGHLFKCWKFRSMQPNSDPLLAAYLAASPAAKEDWEKYRKLANDPRVNTRMARLIRKTSIDELPQLWNVLIGDMSLVGPRPILEDEVHYFGDVLKEYLSIRPGVTGLWQVSGRNDTSFKRRVYWDSWYVRNWSIWNDIVILIKTPLVLITGKGAR